MNMIVWACGSVLGILMCALACNEVSEQPPVVVVQPFSDFPTKKAEQVFHEVRKVCPKSILLPAIPLPLHAYYAPAKRYRADTLIRMLSASTQGDTVTLGLTQKDISVTKGPHRDWGVFGLGYRPGKACVVSTFRLRGKKSLEQLHKVVIHELGHTQGLAHCADSTCYMRDAMGGNPLDEEVGFCRVCRKHLREKGWRLQRLFRDQRTSSIFF